MSALVYIRIKQWGRTQGRWIYGQALVEFEGFSDSSIVGSYALNLQHFHAPKMDELPQFWVK